MRYKKRFQHRVSATSVLSRTILCRHVPIFAFPIVTDQVLFPFSIGACSWLYVNITNDVVDSMPKDTPYLIDLEPTARPTPLSTMISVCCRPWSRFSRLNHKFIAHTMSALGSAAAEDVLPPALTRQLRHWHFCPHIRRHAVRQTYAPVQTHFGDESYCLANASARGSGNHCRVLRRFSIACYSLLTASPRSWAEYSGADLQVRSDSVVHCRSHC